MQGGEDYLGKAEKAFTDLKRKEPKESANEKAKRVLFNNFIYVNLIVVIVNNTLPSNKGTCWV
jgi:hypothetical protein